MHDALPLHYQITKELREGLKKGLWKEGELFPTDKQLMEKYDVSSTTVRRAIYELVKEGWLERKPGKGTFVKGEMVETLQGLTGFFEEIRQKGMAPSADILIAKEIKVTEELLEDVPELKDFDEENLVLIRKVQKMDKHPVVYLDSYWPIEIGSQLIQFDLTSEGMYKLVQENLDLVLEKADQIISAAAATPEVAQALHIKVGDPVLKMRRTVFSGDRIIEVSINHYRADMYSYRVQLNGQLNDENKGIFMEKI